MANNVTYSFGSATIVVASPSGTTYTATGKGVGQVTITPATERTVQDVAADGAIMNSKVLGANGTVAFNVQQTSQFHQWLLDEFNYAVAAPAGKWAGYTVTITAPSMAVKLTMSGAAFQNLPDFSFQADGQQYSWTLTYSDLTATNAT